MGHIRSYELTFFLGDSCNLDCTYCYLNDYRESNNSLDLTFGKAGIDKYIGTNSRQTTRLRFYAVGEPTLEFTLMKDLYDYAKNIYPNVTAELQTSGYWIRKDGQFDEDMANWIASNIDMVWISHDGLPNIHNQQRPTLDKKGSVDIVEKTIKVLLNGHSKVGVRPTISSLSVDKMVEIVEYFYDLGIKYIYFDPLKHQQGKHIKNVGKSIYNISLTKFAKFYVPAWQRAQELDIFCGSFLTINFDEPVEHFCRSCLGAPHLTVDGYIAVCDEASGGGRDERFRSMIIGKYDKTTGKIIEYPEVINKLYERTPKNMSPCNKCNVADNCGGGCLGTANFHFGDINKTLPDFCRAVHYLAKHIPRNQGLFPVTHP